MTARRTRRLWRRAGLAFIAWHTLALAAVALGGVACGSTPSGVEGSGGASSGGASWDGASLGGSGGAEGIDVLVFSRTVEYRHAAIPNGIDALQSLADARGWNVEATEAPSVFTDAGLAEFEVVVFLLTTGDVLAASEQAAFERFIRAGHGFVGVHSASDTEYDWPWYGELVGAYFAGHDVVQEATVIVESAEHPATRSLPSPWRRRDEWYGFDRNPRSTVAVLLTLDESSFTPGAGAMGADHPIAWAHEYDGGRALYTALGHTAESYTEPAFLSHLAGAVEWAAGR